MPLYSETVAFAGARQRASSCPPATWTPSCPAPACSRARPLRRTMLVEEEQAWLETLRARGCARRSTAATTSLRSALLDLRALSVGLPVSVAGWTDRWRYAWPRDVSFVATALARVGHPEHAAEQLAFLQGCSATTAGSRRATTCTRRRTPDDRVAQLDGSAWSVWGAQPARPGRPGPRRGAARRRCGPMLVRSAPAAARLRSTPATAPAAGVVGLLGARRAHGDPGHGGRRCSPGCAAPPSVLPLVGEMALADRTRAASDAAGPPGARAVRRRRGYPRLLGGSAADAAVTFLVAPIGPTGADDEVLAAMRPRAGRDGPPGRRAWRPGVDWKNDGISWTPETALFAAAWAATGHRDRAESLLALARRPPHRRRVVPREGAPRRPPGRGGPAGVDGGARRHRPARAGARVRRWALLPGAVRSLVPSRVLAGRRRTAVGGRRRAEPTAARCRRALVVVGAPGLAWSDLDRGDLPALDAMAGEGAVGSLTVRAVRSRVVRGRRLAHPVGRAPCRRRPGPVPRAAARRRRVGAALGGVPRRRGRRLVRRPPGHAR